MKLSWIDPLLCWIQFPMNSSVLLGKTRQMCSSSRTPGTQEPSPACLESLKRPCGSWPTYLGYRIDSSLVDPPKIECFNLHNMNSLHLRIQYDTVLESRGPHDSGCFKRFLWVEHGYQWRQNIICIHMPGSLHYIQHEQLSVIII
jgi:hypothetical protein